MKITTDYSPGQLRAIAKRLVIKLGYLEHCLVEGGCQRADRRWYRYRARLPQRAFGQLTAKSDRLFTNEASVYKPGAFCFGNLVATAV